MADGKPLVLVDVRSAGEAAVCRIAGSRLMPLPEFAEFRAELASEPRVVLHCKSGVRSAQAAALLQDVAKGQVFNLKGGILAWIDRCDPSLARY
jgi:adenylyltransferase/sulfurtransferase